MPRRTWNPPILPVGVLDPRYVFIDVEASGLLEDSFPVEVAISDDALDMRSWVIRPQPGWVPGDWAKVEAIHGLSWECVMAGSPARIVADELEAAVGGRIVISDAEHYDGGWMDRLYSSIGKARPFRMVSYLEPIIEAVDGGGIDIDAMVDLMDKAGGLCAERFPHTHIAGDDARCLAAWHRMVFDPLFRVAVQDLTT